MQNVTLKEMKGLFNIFNIVITSVYQRFNIAHAILVGHLPRGRHFAKVSEALSCPWPQP